MTCKEAASRLGVDHTTVQRYIKHGLTRRGLGFRLKLEAEKVPLSTNAWRKVRYNITVADVRTFKRLRKVYGL